MKLQKNLLHTTDAYIKKLASAGVITTSDFIFLFPKNIENKSDLITDFTKIHILDKQTIYGIIEIIQSEVTRYKKTLIKAVLKDENGNYLEIAWFNRKFLLTKFARGDRVIVFGKPKYEYGKLSLTSPEIEHFRENRKEIFPVYSDINYISGTWIRDKMELLKPFIEQISDPLPKEILHKKSLPPLKESLFSIHFPKSEADFENAKKALAYREVYAFQERGISKKYE